MPEKNEQTFTERLDQMQDQIERLAREIAFLSEQNLSLADHQGKVTNFVEAVNTRLNGLQENFKDFLC